MTNAIIQYEVILNIVLTVLVICLATYTFAQDMRLKKYKMRLSSMQAARHWQHNEPAPGYPSKQQRLAA